MVVVHQSISVIQLMVHQSISVIQLLAPLESSQRLAPIIGANYVIGNIEYSL